MFCISVVIRSRHRDHRNALVLEATRDIMDTPRHYTGVYEVSRALTASGT